MGEKGSLVVGQAVRLPWLAFRAAECGELRFVASGQVASTPQNTWTELLKCT
jgi:hypothetical protein